MSEAPAVALPVGTEVLVEGFVYHAAEPNENEWAPGRGRFLVPLVRPEGQTTGATPGKRILCNVADIRFAAGADELKALLQEEVTLLVNSLVVAGKAVNPDVRKRIAVLAAVAVSEKFATGLGTFGYLPGRLLPSVPERLRGGDAAAIKSQLGQLLNPRGV